MGFHDVLFCSKSFSRDEATRSIIVLVPLPNKHTQHIAHNRNYVDIY